MTSSSDTGLPILLREIVQKRRDFGTAIRLNGSTSYVNLGNGNPFAGDFFVHMRVKWFGPTATFQHLLSKRTSYGPTTMMFDLAIHNTTGAIIQDTGSSALDTGFTLPIGKWVDLVYTHDGRDKVYINSQLEYQTTDRIMGTGTDAPITIGAVDTPLAEFFNGEIDEIVIGIGNPTWKDVVAMDAKSKFTSDSESEGIYAPWTQLECNEGFGTTLVDSSGNGNDGTLVNCEYSSNVFLKTGGLGMVLPNSISGLVAHYKADSGVYSDAGTTLAVDQDTVQQWNDKSINANNVTQATAGNRPKYVADAINGKPALLFSNARADVLAIADNASISLTKRVHMFAVVKPTTIISTAGIICKDTGALSNPEYAIWLSNGAININLTSAGNTNIGSTANLTAIAGSEYIVEGSYNLININTWQNGELSFTVATNSNGMGDTTGDLRIGAQKATFSTRSFDGYIAEIIIFDRELSSDERVGVEKYLSNKYGITLNI